MEPRKGRALESPILRLPSEKFLTVPLRGAEASTSRRVKSGDRVQRFATLSDPLGGMPIRAPSVGIVQEIKEIQHPLLGEVYGAVLELDGKRGAEKRMSGAMPSGDEIIEIARDAGIVDEFDGVPLYKKLKRIRRLKMDFLFLNGVDDESYVSSALAVLKESSDEVLEGFRLAAAACGIQDLGIAVPESRTVHNFPVFQKETDISVHWIKPVYPGIQILMNQVRKQGKQPVALGVQCCLALKQAVNTGIPQTSTVITLAEAETGKTKNIRVLVGTPVRSVLQFSGWKLPPIGFVMGSPMTGGYTEDRDTPVVPETRCILLISQAKKETGDCIGCGKCALVCPNEIWPWYLYRQMKRSSYLDAVGLPRAERCCGCNACAAVCPAGLPLGKAVRQAAEIKEGDGYQ